MRILSAILRDPNRVCAWLAVLCAFPALAPIRPGVRIPVHYVDGGMVYLDDTGAVALPGRWSYAAPFSQSGTGHVANKNRRCGTITRTGKFTRCPVHPQCSMRHPDTLPIGPDSRGMTLMCDPWRFRWTMADGRPAFPGEWEAAVPFHGDHPAAVCKDGYWGFIDRSGSVVLPYEWDLAWSFDDAGQACVCRDGQWGVIDLTGKLVIPLYFKSMSGFDAGGLCAVEMTNGSGFINRQGKIVIPCRYGKVSPFDGGGLARVVEGSDWGSTRVGWIDRGGRTVIPFGYEDRKQSWFGAFEKHPDVLPVQSGTRSGLIDRHGKWVVPFGGGTLWPEHDPMAPGRQWFVRAPDSEYYGNVAPTPFQPGCYDEHGRLIWSGACINWREPFRWAFMFFGFCWFATHAVRWFKRRRLQRASCVAPT